MTKLTKKAKTQVGKVRLYTQRAIEVLRQIFDGIDIMMRRRRDKPHAGR